MKGRGRRLLRIAVIVLLTLSLIGVGVAVWLHQSGRLAAVATELIQRLAKQDVTIGAVTVTAWDTLVLTDVHLSKQLPGWLLALSSPRIEIHYGLTGLLNKQIDSVAISQPQIDLSHQPDIVLPPSSQPVGAIPLNRLLVQQGIVNLHWRNHTYTVQQLEARVQPQADLHVQVEINGILDDHTARLQMTADFDLGRSQPSGQARLLTKSASLPRLTEMFRQVSPLALQISQGKLDLDIDLQLQAQTIHGVINATAQQAELQFQDFTIRQATLTTQSNVTADNSNQTLHLQGKVELQTAQITKTSDTTLNKISGSTDINLDAQFSELNLKASGQARLTAENLQAGELHLADIALTTPWSISPTAAGWQLTTTPALQSRTARLDTSLHASHLALTSDAPVHVQLTAAGPQVQATPKFHIRSLHVNQTKPPLRITELRGRLPLRGNAMRLNIADAQLQTQAWQQADATPPLLTALELRGSAAVDLQRRHVTWREMVATVPQLGNLSGSGAWTWSSHTLQDLQVQLTPETIEALQTSLNPVLPSDYQGWELNGSTKLNLHAARVALRPPWHIRGLTVDWQIRDGTFNSPDGNYAGEHLNGNIQADADLDTANGQYKLRGTLTLAPFALLLGALFPAIEDNQVSTNVDFSSSYDHNAERLNLRLGGRFRNLAGITLQGAIHQPRTAPHYDLQIRLHELHSNPFWKTFVHDPLQFPSLSQATVKGEFGADLQVTGKTSDLHLNGRIDLTGGHLETGNLLLSGITLALPIQGRYPLPTSAPPTAAFPDDAYGQLSVEAIRLGGVDINNFTTRLALNSDNLVLQPTINIPLWGGQISLKHLTAQHLLQPQRRFTWQTRLDSLDLQQLQRSAAKLPLAGIVDGDFPHLQIVDGRFETQGSLSISVADGTIRLSDLQGSDLFSGTPVLQCSLATEKPLSLVRLTEIYPIGGIGGTLHFTLTDLTLLAGRPEAFALDFAVQERGGEAREITLRALNNLLFTTGSTKVAAGFLGDTQRLPYRRFGVVATLRQDTLRLRGKYHNRKGIEYFMRAPALGAGVSIVNRVPDNGVPFQDFLRRLKATVLEKPKVRVDK